MPGTNVRSRPVACAGIVLFVLAVMLGFTGIAWAFADVPSDSPYAAAITDLSNRHIINGFPGDLFKPNDPVTRQQFAKMIVLTMGYGDVAAATCPFTDVDQTPNASDPLYPAKYVAACALHGITTGKTATTFAPFDPVTRQQLITIVARAANLPNPPASFVPTFTESQFAAHDHYLNACKAQSAGLLAGLQGVGSTFDFSAPANRGECAQLLSNLQKSLAQVNHAPLANAGPDQTVNAGAPVTLDGSASTDADGDALTYTWTQTTGPTATLSGTTVAKPTFTAPAGAATLGFSLVVSDGNLSSVADAITITVRPLSTSLPAFADLKPAGPVGFTFTLNTPTISAIEHTTAGRIWPATLTASTITGHLTVQTVAVANGQVTVKLTLDSLTVPQNQFFSQTDVNQSLPAYLLLRVDNQGTVLGVSYASKGEPEQALDQATVAGLATFVTPITSALMLPYSGQVVRPGDQLDLPKTYTMLGKKTMDVDTKLNYLSFNSGVADLGFNIAATNIDIPLTFDMAPLLPLFGYHVPADAGPLTMSVSLGTSVLGSGDYHLDTTSGLPTGLTLSCTMMLDAYIHSVPPQLAYMWPDSDFAQGHVDHAYLRGADQTSPITITLSMTKDAAH